MKAAVLTLLLLLLPALSLAAAKKTRSPARSDRSPATAPADDQTSTGDPAAADDSPTDGGEQLEPYISPFASKQRVRRDVIWGTKFDDTLTTAEYAKQLDYFKIELGAEDDKGQVQYAGNLSGRKPDRRLGHRQDDERVSASWTKGKLVAADRKLLAKAGINLQGKKLLHFFPDKLTEELYHLEQNYAGKDAPLVVRTRFRIRAKKDGPGLEMYVDEQELKTAYKTDSPGTSAFQPARTESEQE